MLIRRFTKNNTSQQIPASTTKLLTAIVAHDVLGAGDLSSTVTVISSDVVDWGSNSNMQLEVGDVLSLTDLFYGLMLPSGNDAALVLARVAGGQMLASEGGSDSDVSANRARFIVEMNDYADSYGMGDSVFTDAAGIASGNLTTADDLARLMLNYCDNPALVTIAGTLTREITITGVNARTYNVNHTIDPSGAVPIPEFICGKTGTKTIIGNPAETSGGCCAILWQSPLGVKRISVVMGSYPPEDRYVALRKMIDFELASLGEL